MNNTHISTTIEMDYSDKHPLRRSIERYRHKKMSETTWKKISNTWLRNVENMFINSGISIMEDWLNTPQGNNKVKKIVQDIEMRKDFYFE